MVSSLELIGSPGGFARTLGTGLRDFVSLPYHGILEGPWGFLVGVTHGSASLMKHFTAGKCLFCGLLHYTTPVLYAFYFIPP